MKWAVVGFNFSAQRYQLLNEFLSRAIAGSQLELVEVHPVEFTNKLSEVLDAFDQVRVETPYGLQAIKSFKRRSMAMNSLQSVDSIVKRGGEWWPESCLFTAVSELLSRNGTALDVSGEVIVVGAGAAARVVSAGLLRAGFRHIRIANKYDDEGLTLIEELKRTFLGCRFDYVPQDRLVLLPGTSCLLINTTPLTASNDLLNELNYLNFLRRDGMIWDFVLTPARTPLIREGEQINIHCIHGAEIAALTDSIWLNRIGAKGITEAEIRDRYLLAFDAPEKSD